ncbi:unnamed protein product [Effrenium voratum]|nr:unnamed protein product [Effrenium voratum]|mmetsp:Transcript_13132/g.31115  ORF Transcript_13132/g.31115 Transcript_13132/m.31115 type:complete len:1129 (-) Transcript_13132:134-3520(-)
MNTGSLGTGAQIRRAASAEQSRHSLDLQSDSSGHEVHRRVKGGSHRFPGVEGHRAEGRDGAHKRNHRPVPTSRRRASPHGRLASGHLEGAHSAVTRQRIDRKISGALRTQRSDHSPEAFLSPLHESGRASSVDKCSPDTSGLRKQAEEAATKFFLQREIEARSLRMHSWQRAEASVFAADKEPTRPWRKLIVVCAKLPFTIVWDEEKGTLRVERDQFEANFAEILAAEITDGKVQSSVRVRSDQVILVGAPVVRRVTDRSLVTACDEALQQELTNFLRKELKVATVPVFPPSGRDRFADQVIFPLFHYTPPSMETGIGLYDWDGYKLVNESFCDAVLQQHQRGDLVLINDYPLMLLPKALRKERPDISIGFYIHCVFPSSEVYRILPQREELLRGVLSSNVIGFHNFQYVRHFLTAATRILGCECTASGIDACEDAGGTSTKVIAVPLGIHLEPYSQVWDQEDTKKAVEDLKRTYDSKTILMAVDRLEEKEGIPHKIMAFHKFLSRFPSWASNVVFVQLVVAAKTDDEEAPETREERQKLLQQVYQMGGECNSAFGSITHAPFHFLHQDISRTDITALMVKAHVFMDTPLRDTLSREAHEFVWCQEEQDCGVLILSEFSGSAQSLRAAALCVNPWDTTAFADAIQEAIEMEFQDRRELHIYGHKHVYDHTLRRWATNFLDEICSAERECEDERLQIPPPLDHETPVTAMRQAHKRIFVFGFSGTLLPRKSRLQAKILGKLHPVLAANLKVLAEEPNTHVIIMSSLEQELLSEAIGSLPCWIIAEGGVCYREPDGTWLNMELQDKDWLAPAKEIMEYFAARTPGSRVIETTSSVSWHYQKTQGDHAAIQSKDLLIHLWAGPLLSAPAEVVVGNDEVSVRPTGVSKASQLEKILQRICCEEGTNSPTLQWQSDVSVTCICDLITKDEDVYLTLQKFFDQDGTKVTPAPMSRMMSGDDVSGRTGSLGTPLSVHEPMTDDWAGLDSSRQEVMNLEANSKSLGAFFNKRIAKNDDDAPPFGLHKPSSSSQGSNLASLSLEPHSIKKMPSEPELLASAPAAQALSTGKVSLITVTVSRKPTRAMYHVNDTTDVTFLIARLAREMRQMKQAHEHECTAAEESKAKDELQTAHGQA